MDFQWLNKGNITTENGKIEIYAPAQSDFFCNNGAVSEEGITPETLCNAPSVSYTHLTLPTILLV